MEKWYDQAVFYHIYPFGLCGVEKENTGKEEYHFDQLEDWIPHIKQLGCTAIYIGPLFESVGHGYETTDYKKVDCRLGTNEDFKRYVKKCHEAGIKVIVDGVFNHTGREFFAFKDIKQNRENSRYKDWYCNVNFWGNNEYNDGFCYDNWGGYNLLVKLNQRNPEVKDYIYDVIRFWVSEFDIDGIRLDAADVLDFDFMKGIRHVADEVKEDFWLMGEVIHGDYSRWANGEMLHSVTNYELHKGLFSGHNDHNYFEIAHSVKRLLGLCGKIKLYTFADNHDVARIYNKLNEKAHLYPVTILLYTLPGIPSIYYGSEFSIEGAKEKGSDYSLRPYINLEDYAEKKIAAKADSNENAESDGEGFGAANEDMVWEYKEFPHKDIFELMQKLGELKKEYKELTLGEYRELSLTTRQFAYGRVLDNKAVVVALNNDENPAHMEIPIPVGAAQVKDLLAKIADKTKENAAEDSTEDAEYTEKQENTEDKNLNDIQIRDGKIILDVAANSGKVLYLY